MFRKIVLLAVLFVASVASTNVRECIFIFYPHAPQSRWEINQLLYGIHDLLLILVGTKGRPFPLAVNIEGCSTMPCNVIKGTTAVMNVHFVGTRDNIKSIFAQVKATTLGLTVPYELPEEIADVCANLMDEAVCPIDKGEDVIYSFKFPIDSHYPEISVKVEVSLVDEATKESVSCFVADIKVKKESSSSQ